MNREASFRDDGGEAEGPEDDFGEASLRLVDQALAQLGERDPARPLLYQLRRRLMERELSYQETRRAMIEGTAKVAAAGKVKAR